MGGATGTAVSPSAEHRQCAGRGSKGRSALTWAVKMFGTATNNAGFFEKKKPKRRADVGGGGVNEARRIQNTSGGSGEFAGIRRDGKVGKRRS